jgi:hypothetical protein
MQLCFYILPFMSKSSTFNLSDNKSSRLFEFEGCVHHFGFTLGFIAANLIGFYIVLYLLSLVKQVCLYSPNL